MAYSINNPQQAVVTNAAGCYTKDMKKTKKGKLTKAERDAYAIVGRVGGRATAKKGKRYMSSLGKKGAAKRWKKTPESK
jgi:hypothetical protein